MRAINMQDQGAYLPTQLQYLTKYDLDSRAGLTNRLTKRWTKHKVFHN
jgi:hypothetical protein